MDQAAGPLWYMAASFFAEHWLPPQIEQLQRIAVETGWYSHWDVFRAIWTLHTHSRVIDHLLMHFRVCNFHEQPMPQSVLDDIRDGLVEEVYPFVRDRSTLVRTCLEVVGIIGALQSILVVPP